MFNSPLFFFVAVLLISDVAEAKVSQEFLSTVNTTEGLHELVDVAHYLTALAYKQLDGVSGSPGKAIARASNLVEEVLQKMEQKTKGPKNIIQELMRALKAEVRALTKVIKGCLSSKTVANPSMKSMYDKARDYLGSAVLCLIEAIAKVEDVLNKAKITKLREDFFNNASADPDHIRELGKNVLKVMNAY